MKCLKPPREREKDLGSDIAWAKTASLGNRALRWL